MTVLTHILQKRVVFEHAAIELCDRARTHTRVQSRNWHTQFSFQAVSQVKTLSNDRVMYYVGTKLDQKGNLDSKQNECRDWLGFIAYLQDSLTEGLDSDASPSCMPARLQER